jgi:hypothetical protein
MLLSDYLVGALLSWWKGTPHHHLAIKFSVSPRTNACQEHLDRGETVKRLGKKEEHFN